MRLAASCVQSRQFFENTLSEELLNFSQFRGLLVSRK
jgi:hypothetical protein